MIRRLMLWLAVVAGVVVVQSIYCLRVKIPEVSPEAFSEVFVGVGSFLNWNVGYVAGTHGAALARSTGAPRADGREPKACEGLTEAMRHELDTVPRKFVLEVAFYLALVAVAGVLAAKRPSPGRHRLAWSMYAPTILLLLAGAPCALWCYGASIYSNYVGPCWLSCSGGWLTVTFIPAETVSYRSFLEAVAWLPMVLGTVTRVTRLVPEMHTGLFVYLVACPVYMLGGLGLHCLAGWVGRRRRNRG
jgi:hypothetical protein